jgi:hypothetical protein
LGDDDIQSWKDRIKQYLLFFDVASKGNARGVISNVEENKEIEYVWGLEITPNNEAKSLVVFQGLATSKEK